MASTLTNLNYHVIFSTKNRYPLIQSSVQRELFDYIGGILRNRKAILLEIGGIEDHVHLVIKLKADLSISEIVRVVKANSSKWMNERFGPAKMFAWQVGYGAFTVSSSQLNSVCRYVECQKEHHAKRSFKEEYLAFLKGNNLAFDAEHVWG